MHKDKKRRWRNKPPTQHALNSKTAKETAECMRHEEFKRSEMQEQAAEMAKATEKTAKKIRIAIEL
jgi:ribosomal protein S8E